MRLEGWVRAPRLLRTLRDAALRAAPQGEVVRVGAAFLLVVASLAAAQASAAEPVPTPKPIYFSAGSPRGWVGGHVQRGDVDLYSVKAMEEQIMTVRLTAPGGNAVFQIYEPDTAIGRGNDGALEFKRAPLFDSAKTVPIGTRWSGPLPHDGTYIIAVGSTRGNARYSMEVRLE
jgi:hypothetical protein